MFKEGNNNVDVAITLDMSPYDVMANYLDYQRLQDLDDFIQLYSDLGDDLPLLIFLYKRMKLEGLLNKKEILSLIRVESDLKELAWKIDKECHEIGRLNLIRLQLIDELKALVIKEIKISFLS